MNQYVLTYYITFKNLPQCQLMNIHKKNVYNPQENAWMYDMNLQSIDI